MHNRRKFSNYLIDPRFQLRFIGLMLLASLVPLGVAFGIASHFIRQNYAILVKYGVLEPQIVELLNRELSFLVGMILGAVVVCLTMIGLVGLVFSHRVAGPIYAMRRGIRMIKETGKGFLNIRPNDEWQDFVREMNELIENIRTRSKQAS